MQICQAGSMKYYLSSSLEGFELYHAFFTRHGGISPTPWKSLNFGASVGDDPQRVLQNRQAALVALDIKPESVYDVYQVHSNEIIVTDRPLDAGEAHKKADAILTARPGVTLLMRFADCVPILLFDPQNRVVGMVHAGWMGTVNKIATQAIKIMQGSFGSHPDDVLAVIGPSIGPDHYPVGEDVIRKARISFGSHVDSLLNQLDGKTYFNLWEANRVNLWEAGVINIEIAWICTHCHIEDWYSHRGERGKTGRFGAILGIYE
jgi:YfiH family protein